MLLKDLQNHVLAIKNLCFSSHHVTQLANLFDESSFFLLDLVGNKSSVTVSASSCSELCLAIHGVAFCCRYISSPAIRQRYTAYRSKVYCWASVSSALKQTTVSPF